MTISVRAVTMQDWQQLWPMLQDMGVSGQPEHVHRDLYADLGYDPRWVVLGATDDFELVGYAAVQDYGPHLRAGDEHRVARLHDLYVRPDRRRRGTGRVLMDAVEEWAGARVRHLEWQAHVDRAAPFYERIGYHGDPCPQPDYPTFLLDFPVDAHRD